MIKRERDKEIFRQIAKLHCQFDRIYEDEKLTWYTTIDKFDYEEETVILNVHPYNDKYKLEIDLLLENIQSMGVYKNYSIDRSTKFCTSNIERLVANTTEATEV